MAGLKWSWEPGLGFSSIFASIADQFPPRAACLPLTPLLQAKVSPPPLLNKSISSFGIRRDDCSTSMFKAHLCRSVSGVQSWHGRKTEQASTRPAEVPYQPCWLCWPGIPGWGVGGLKHSRLQGRGVKKSQNGDHTSEASLVTRCGCEEARCNWHAHQCHLSGLRAQDGRLLCPTGQRRGPARPGFKARGASRRRGNAGEAFLHRNVFPLVRMPDFHANRVVPVHSL